MIPMKMTDTPVGNADMYINDDAYCMEQKMDGARALCTWTRREGATWQASGGGPLEFAAAKQHLDQIEMELSYMLMSIGAEEAVLDGEIIVEDGVYHLFDLPYLRYIGEEAPQVRPEDSQLERSNMLSLMLRYMADKDRSQPHVCRVKTVWSISTKRELWNAIRAAGVEGAIVKRRDAPYEPGKRSLWYRKLKLVKTIDVIVTDVTREIDEGGMVRKGSAELAVMITPEQDPTPYRHLVTGRRHSRGRQLELVISKRQAERTRGSGYVYEPRGQLKIAAASLIGKDKTIMPGDVVEVAYLYAQEGGSLVQPRILRKREPDEKIPADCTLDQIPTYSRGAV